MLSGHLWLAAMLHGGFHKLIPNLHQCKQQMTQRYMGLSDFSKAFRVNVSARLDFHLITEIDVQKASPSLHTVRSYWTLMVWTSLIPHLYNCRKSGIFEKRRAFQCMEYALHSLLSHFTHQVLWAWSRSHMAKAAQNMGFLCSANLLFQYFVFIPNCDGKRMFVIGLKLQKHFSETFINEEKQVDIFQAERFHCFLLN